MSAALALASLEGTHCCGGCGATYRVVYRRAPFPVTDSFNCQVCRRELASWIGCRVPDYSLLNPELRPAPSRRSPFVDEEAWSGDGSVAVERRASFDV